MKPIILILLLLLNHSSSFGQENCKKRQLDSLEKSINREYINQATKNNWGSYDFENFFQKNNDSHVKILEKLPVTENITALPVK